MNRNTYILTKDFNWFGKTIPKGTLYVQYNGDKDKYRCVSEGNEKPHFDLTFYTLNAPWASEYFAKVNK